MRTRVQAFLLATCERAVKTFAQTAGAGIISGGATLITGVDWEGVLGTAGLAAVLSVLFSIVSGGVGGVGPSLGGEKLDTSKAAK